MWLLKSSCKLSDQQENLLQSEYQARGNIIRWLLHLVCCICAITNSVQDFTDAGAGMCG